jgi:L-fuculose-phosphate aldolase
MSAQNREERIRDEVAACSRSVHQRGWVANHDGNISARVGVGRFVITPTAVSKGDVLVDWLVTVDASGQVLAGERRPPSELALHRCAWSARPDVGVVIHAHPPHATAFATAGVPVPHPFLAEAAVSLGPVIPLVPWFRPGDPQLDVALTAALALADVVVLDRHGVLVVGGDIEQALLRLELVEHLAGIAARATALGGVRLLDAADVAALCKAGRPASTPQRDLDAAAPGATSTGVAPSPNAPRPLGPRPDVRAVVEEARRRLG